MGLASWKDTAVRDVRYAFRQFVRSPLLTSVAVISIAAGIGANSTIFSIMNQVMLRSLPVHDPKQLIIVTDPNSGGVAVGMLP